VEGSLDRSHCFTRRGTRVDREGREEGMGRRGIRRKRMYGKGERGIDIGMGANVP